MSEPQIIKTPGGEEYVLLYRKDYEALMEALADAQEDLADIATLDKRLAEIAADPAPFLPAEISPLILKGMRRREALRVWRGLSLGEVSKLTGIDELTLNVIEQGRLKCSQEMAAQLAKALNIPESWVAD